MNALVKAGIEAVFGALGRLLVQVVESFRDRGTLDKVVELAELHVANFAASTAPPEEKRRMATAAVQDDLRAAGLAVATSAIHLAIEAAWNALKPALEAASQAAAGGESAEG